MASANFVGGKIDLKLAQFAHKSCSKFRHGRQAENFKTDCLGTGAACTFAKQSEKPFSDPFSLQSLPD
jgi:hypothetical protein